MEWRSRIVVVFFLRRWREKNPNRWNFSQRREARRMWIWKCRKQQVQRALMQIFHLSKIPRPDDAADAITIAYAGHFAEENPLMEFFDACLSVVFSLQSLEFFSFSCYGTNSCARKTRCPSTWFGGNIVNRFERKGLKLIGMKMLALGDDVLEEHYAHVADKPFFRHAKIMKSTPIIAMCWEGKEELKWFVCFADQPMLEKQTWELFGRSLYEYSVQYCPRIRFSRSSTRRTESIFKAEELFSYQKMSIFISIQKTKRV